MPHNLTITQACCLFYRLREELDGAVASRFAHRRRLRKMLARLCASLAGPYVTT